MAAFLSDEPPSKEIPAAPTNTNTERQDEIAPLSTIHETDTATTQGGDVDEDVAPVIIDLDVLRQAQRKDVSGHIKSHHPKRNPKRLRSFYTKQNDLIEDYLGVGNEEQAATEEEDRLRPRVKFAVNASFIVNLCLFVIQMYAAISTGSLSLFATAADAFMDLVSSCVMLVTSRLARRPNLYKFPVGRTRIEPVGIIVFCALMATVAVQLLIESARALAGGHQDSAPLRVVPLVMVGVAIFSKTSLMIYCFFYRRVPSVHVFFVDHRNDIVVNIFGLVMSIVGDRFVWYLDPIGAICVALLILFSWAANAFEQVWLLAGKGAPRQYVSKLLYVSLTHSVHIRKVDTCRAYHAGQNYYVEVDVIMDADTPLRISHDVSQSLQRKLEGLADVERAFVHVDYEQDHDVHEEHKPPYDNAPRKTLREYFRGFLRKTKN